MNAPFVAEHFDIATERPVIPVQRERDLFIGACVAGTVVSRYALQNIGFGARGTVWGLEVALDGGLSGGFGCTQEDMDRFRGGDIVGKRFTAVVGSGVGPPPGGMDLEPTSVFYLKDIAAESIRPSPQIVVVQANPAQSLDFAS